MKVKERIFHIRDVDCYIAIEVMSKQKDILELMDEHIDNIKFAKSLNDDSQFGRFVSDDVFMILYKNGKSEYIDSAYDGHKVKRNGIVSIVCNGDYGAMVYGAFEINEFGAVTTAEKETIADRNIKEVKPSRHTRSIRYEI